MLHFNVFNLLIGRNTYYCTRDGMFNTANKSLYQLKYLHEIVFLSKWVFDSILYSARKGNNRLIHNIILIQQIWKLEKCSCYQYNRKDNEIALPLEMFYYLSGNVNDMQHTTYISNFQSCIMGMKSLIRLGIDFHWEVTVCVMLGKFIFS